MPKVIKINVKVKRALYLKACDYCLDLSKIVMGGVVLASVMSMDIDKVFVLGLGVAATIILAVMGFFFYIVGHQRKI